jgi:CHASE2 domain-containing sensor protein
LLPSLVLLLERGGSLRLIGLIAGGTVCVVVGAVHRLQAPMLLGAAVLVTIGIDALSPIAAGLPGWIPLGASGLVILWIGITFERRLNNVRHLRDNVRSLQ